MLRRSGRPALQPMLGANLFSIGAVDRDAYEASLSRCGRGAIGALLTLSDDLSVDTAAVSDTLQSMGVNVTRTFGTLLRGVAAEMPSSSLLDAVLALPEVSAAEADCIITTPSKEEPEGEVGSWAAPMSSGSGGSQSNAVWGLDRIDARAGLDGSYSYGNSTAAGTRIYILDTGVRASHDDFGGRAVGGWSAGCWGASEHTCGASWRWQGVITDAACHAHGTHCASSAAGSTYGVAKGATIVSVQVLDCNGAGTSSSTLGGIEWAVEDALAHPSNPAVISMSIGGNFSAAVNDAVEQAKVRRLPPFQSLDPLFGLAAPASPHPHPLMRYVSPLPLSLPAHLLCTPPPLLCLPGQRRARRGCRRQRQRRRVQVQPLVVFRGADGRRDHEHGRPLGILQPRPLRRHLCPRKPHSC